VVGFVVLAVAVVLGYVWWMRSGGVVRTCPATLERAPDGSLKLSTGETFPDMNAFQQWWAASGYLPTCPVPRLTGATREVPVMEAGATGAWGTEQTFATTPIYKVDDYELSRVFGYEREGRMDVPRQNFNKILETRAFDWPEKPLSSDERQGKYRGLQEGFTATGDLAAVPVTGSAAKEAAARFGERPHDRRRAANKEVEDDIECTMSREAREVAGMVAKAYEDDPNWEPVVTRVGPHHWEVNELKPRRREGDVAAAAVEERVVDTSKDAVDVAFAYRQSQDIDAALDPFYATLGDLPFQSEKTHRDPYYGPVPGMERPFGPTFDRADWTMRETA
jgi:hypothetical protein